MHSNDIHLINRIVVLLYFFVNNLNVNQFEWIHYRTRIYPLRVTVSHSLSVCVCVPSLVLFALCQYVLLTFFSSRLFCYRLFSHLICVYVCFFFKYSSFHFGNLLIQVCFHQNSRGRLRRFVLEFWWKTLRNPFIVAFIHSIDIFPSSHQQISLLFPYR